MNDQRFFDLAMKVIARQATDAERVELESLLAQEPEFRAEFERLETDARVAKDVLPVIAACTESTGEFPAYARERLQTAVRQALGRPKFAAKQPPPIPAQVPAHAMFMPSTGGAFDGRQSRTMPPTLPGRNLSWSWRWVLGLAIATAVVLLLAVFRTPNAPVIQLAIVDAGGGTRGAETNEVATFEETWKGIPVQNFSNSSELEAWEKNWPNGDGRPAAKVIYDPAAGEVRVSGRSRGKFFQRTFPVEKDLATTLQQVGVFTREQTKR